MGYPPDGVWCLYSGDWSRSLKSALLAKGHCCVQRDAWGRDLAALHHGHKIQPHFFPHSEPGTQLQTFPEHGGVIEEDQSVNTLPMKHSQVAEVRGAALQPRWSRPVGAGGWGCEYIPATLSCCLTHVPHPAWHSCWKLAFNRCSSKPVEGSTLFLCDSSFRFSLYLL